MGGGGREKEDSVSVSGWRRICHWLKGGSLSIGGGGERAE